MASDIYHQAHVESGDLMLEDDSLAATLPVALQSRLEDWLALELTAERMASERLSLVGSYIANDSRQFLDDIKFGLKEWEIVAFEFLLSAADPSQREWLLQHWQANENTDASEAMKDEG